MFGSLIKIKSGLVSLVIDQRLRKFRLKPSRFHVRHVRDLVLYSGEGIEDSDGDNDANDTRAVTVAPTEVVGLSELISLTGL